MTESMRNVSFLVLLLCILSTTILVLCAWVDPVLNKGSAAVKSEFVPILLMLDPANP